MTRTEHILRIIKEKNYATVFHIQHALDASGDILSEAVLKTQITQLKKAGFIDWTEISTCVCCGRLTREYFLTDKGKERIHNHVSKADQVAINEACDKYLEENTSARGLYF